MKVVNAVKFIFPGISENERTARAVVSAFLVQLDPTVEELGRYSHGSFRGGDQCHCPRLPEKQG